MHPVKAFLCTCTIVFKIFWYNELKSWFFSAAKGFIPNRLLQKSQIPDTPVHEETNQIYPTISVPTSPISPTVIGMRQNVPFVGSLGSQGSPPGGEGQSRSSVDGGQSSGPRSPQAATLVSRQSFSKELDDFLDEDMTPDLSSTEDNVQHECEEVGCWHRHIRYKTSWH